ncbi:MAG: NUDIX domain-containing protein [Candidatus Sungbacteria bacterium]|nr:NUDIX domain-containing protein [Candidatus Sungbacteria bacterium]
MLLNSKETKHEILKDFLRQREALFSQGIFAPPPNIMLCGENFLSVKAAAERAQKIEVTIHNWINRGTAGLKLEAIKVRWHSEMYYVKEGSLDCILTRLSTAVPMPTQMRLIPKMHLILPHGEDKNSVLLMRSWDPQHEKRMYGLVSGHLRFHETFVDAMARIATERIHAVFDSEILKQVHAMHRNARPECLDIFFTPEQGKTWLGELYNTHPGKYYDMKWVPLNALPDTTLPHIRKALEYYQNNIPFSSYGWES